MVEEAELPSHPLFHYTDAGGLLGILKSETLWARHAAYLNDAEEITYGLNAILKELKSMTLSLSMPKELDDDELWPSTMKRGRWLATKALFVLTAAATQDRMNFLQQNAGPFVTCLTVERDRLSQWRGYSGDGGYAIGFDPQALRDSVRESPLGTQLKFEHPSFGPVELGRRHVVRMRYAAETDFVREKLYVFFREVLRYIAAHNRDDASFDKQKFDEAGNILVRQRLSWLLSIAVQTKNPGFEEENEHRIVTFAEPDEFDARAVGLAPRVNIKFDPACVAEILVGPGANLEQRRLSIEYYKNSHPQYSHVLVSASKTPFRGT